MLAPVPGFRAAVLDALPSGTPQAGWNEAEYAGAAARRVAAARRRVKAMGPLPQVALEIGCGAGLDCLVAALEGVPRVIGIDRDPPLLDRADAGRASRARRLLAGALALYGRSGEPEEVLAASGVEILKMDATRLDLPTASVDALWSRTALEHVQPLDRALEEMARVLRPGGIAHHVIDPFFWLKGCHARGLTELPWAHARLDLDDYERFVRRAESRRRAARRVAWLRSLNRLTAAEWHARFDADPAFEVVSVTRATSSVAKRFLARYPEVIDTTLPGLTFADLTCESVEVLTRSQRSVREISARL